jgi:hypothetical protein
MRFSLTALVVIASTLALTGALCATAHAEISLTAPGLAPTADDAPRPADGSIIEPKPTSPVKDHIALGPDGKIPIDTIDPLPRDLWDADVARSKADDWGRFAKWEIRFGVSLVNWAGGGSAIPRSRAFYDTWLETDFLPRHANTSDYPTLWHFGGGFRWLEEAKLSDAATPEPVTHPYSAWLFYKLSLSLRLFVESAIVAIPTRFGDQRAHALALGLRMNVGHTYRYWYELRFSAGVLTEPTLPVGLHGRWYGTALVRTRLGEGGRFPLALGLVMAGGEWAASLGMDVTLP